MTRKPIEVRYVHAGDLTTKQAHELEWLEGDIGSRYQEIAIVGDRVVGSWLYCLEWHRGRVTIDSSNTNVTLRMHRRGVASSLWLHGVARWRPRGIKAMIGTDEGRGFLAAMRARLAYVSPETFLHVKRRPEDAQGAWEEQCAWEAHVLLRKLGEERAASVKKLAKPAAPALLRSAS